MQIEQAGIDSNTVLPYIAREFGVDHFTAGNSDNINDALVSII
jgi:hypothetical protein